MRLIQYCASPGHMQLGYQQVPPPLPTGHCAPQTPACPDALQAVVPGSQSQHHVPRSVPISWGQEIPRNHHAGRGAVGTPPCLRDSTRDWPWHTEVVASSVRPQHSPYACSLTGHVPATTAARATGHPAGKRKWGWHVGPGLRRGHNAGRGLVLPTPLMTCSQDSKNRA